MNPDQWKLASLQYLEYLHGLGIQSLPKPHGNLQEILSDWTSVSSKASSPLSQALEKPPAATPKPSAVPEPSPKPAPAAKRPAGPQGESPWSTPAKNPQERTELLGQLKLQVENCRTCTDLACQRQQTVFGVGPVSTRFVMVGEAPGAEEDRTGEPFVGPAGQLLDRILTATGIPREQVYILNTLKCRPPNNRVPSETEIENCRPFFEAQLEILQPDYIICWGATAVRAILGTTEPVGRLRGRFHAYKKAKVIATYHPSYLLRAPEAKKLTWEDMKMLMRELGTLTT